MKRFLLISLISFSAMASQLPMTCYKKIVSPECKFFTHDPLVNVGKQYWITCEGTIIGKNYNDKTVSRPIYRQENYYPSLGGPLQRISLSFKYKGSMNDEIDAIIENMDKCE